MILKNWWKTGHFRGCIAKWNQEPECLLTRQYPSCTISPYEYQSTLMKPIVTRPFCSRSLLFLPNKKYQVLFVDVKLYLMRILIVIILESLLISFYVKLYLLERYVLDKFIHVSNQFSHLSQTAIKTFFETMLIFSL